ncbi:uncharacterized protein N7459_007116 [Penicillium hispanicum]|uniref:uncharacterized protein n=1 Tax=Penicillium hispanicum TaxID=1080232 RepID=UPI0025407ABD|nr:uncharacterized protein N7459_007116 [Penicillium hispanicum]KAJ5578152.1 hypothetical protein N7459_007116 [Penicillium hispanicum]
MGLSLLDWTTASLLLSAACLVSSRASPRHAARATVTDWALIAPSTNLKWTSCFDNFTCARLEVPLDYGDPPGNASIAFMKIAAQNATKDTPNLLVNPGGPGGSGIQLIQEQGQTLVEMIESYNIVGFDPRGVGESGPSIDCWPGHPERGAEYERLFYSQTSNASSTALDTQYYAAEIFGKACTETVGGSKGNASFISTPAMAQDMLTYINAEQEAVGKLANDSKISYLGVSYGTVLGATFAHLFPDRIDKMILDGVFVPSDYYNLGWRTNLYDTDKVLSSFSDYCHQAGASNCTFWGPSVHNISRRLNQLVEDLKYHPIPIQSSEACEIPLLGTYSALKEYILETLYSPLTDFPELADVLSGLERGNTSAFMSAIVSGSLPASPCNNGTARTTTDVDTLIKCVDGYSGQHFKDIDVYRDYVDTLATQSQFFGEVWSNNANGVSCRAVNVKPPKSARLSDSIMDPRRTSYPIMFVTSELDPITPKRGAYKMSSVFPGSIVIEQKSVGHTAIASASSCLLTKIQSYLNGELPKANTTCQPDTLPFQGSGSPLGV